MGYWNWNMNNCNTGFAFKTYVFSSFIPSNSLMIIYSNCIEHKFATNLPSVVPNNRYESRPLNWPKLAFKYFETNVFHVTVSVLMVSEMHCWYAPFPTNNRFKSLLWCLPRLEFVFFIRCYSCCSVSRNVCFLGTFSNNYGFWMSYRTCTNVGIQMFHVKAIVLCWYQICLFVRYFFNI